MSNNNSIKLVGNLGTNPETKVGSVSGKPFVVINLGVHESWTNKETGEPQQRTDWFRVLVNGKTADEVMKLKTGDFVSVEGKLATAKPARDGVTQYETFVRAFSVTKLEAKAKAEAEAAAASEAANSAPAFDEALSF